MEIIELKFSLDGDKVCCMFGDNLMDGYIGFGDTPENALRDFADDMEAKGGYPFLLYDDTNG